MASTHAWLEVLSWTKAVFDAITLGASVSDAYQKHKQEPATISESRRASVAFSTYSDEELDALAKRLQQCQAIFIAEGDGEQRNRCFCSVLNHYKVGNGGVLPPIDNLVNMYAQMHCDAFSRGKRR
jgi:hypothetical protein